MTIDRAHLYLTVSLAGLVGFGTAHLLSSKDAVAYPSGPAVSYGANPIFSVGDYVVFSGTAGGVSTDTLSLGASGQEVVITDIIVTTTQDETAQFYCSATLAFEDSTTTLAEFGVTLPNLETVAPPRALDIDLGSGIRLAEGETLTVTATTRVAYNSYCSGVHIHYTISGYYAKP